jgi:hypothetical protein
MLRFRIMRWFVGAIVAVLTLIHAELYEHVETALDLGGTRIVAMSSGGSNTVVLANATMNWETKPLIVSTTLPSVEP